VEPALNLFQGHSLVRLEVWGAFIAAGIEAKIVGGDANNSEKQS